ncbi:hypothetical protein GF312_15300 [Candidatus Poribacteria bacterium]|nr:hypothetical protein [Candidatus Poribacteria bacterium]
MKKVGEFAKISVAGVTLSKLQTAAIATGLAGALGSCDRNGGSVAGPEDSAKFSPPCTNHICSNQYSCSGDEFVCTNVFTCRDDYECQALIFSCSSNFECSGSYTLPHDQGGTPG